MLFHFFGITIHRIKEIEGNKGGKNQEEREREDSFYKSKLCHSSSIKNFFEDVHVIYFTFGRLFTNNPYMNDSADRK